MEAPEFPVFNKQATCSSGPGDDVHMPRVSKLLDYEGELAIVIGERCRHVPEERAAEVIAGYTFGLPHVHGGQAEARGASSGRDLYLPDPQWPCLNPRSARPEWSRDRRILSDPLEPL